MEKKHLSSFFWPKFINPNVAVRGINVSSSGKDVWRVRKPALFVYRKLREKSSERRGYDCLLSSSFDGSIIRLVCYECSRGRRSGNEVQRHARGGSVRRKI